METRSQGQGPAHWAGFLCLYLGCSGELLTVFSDLDLGWNGAHWADDLILHLYGNDAHWADHLILCLVILFTFAHTFDGNL